ncbi:unnamed protein product [Boreogadus saida]
MPLLATPVLVSLIPLFVSSPLDPRSLSARIISDPSLSLPSSRSVSCSPSRLISSSLLFAPPSHSSSSSRGFSVCILLTPLLSKESRSSIHALFASSSSKIVRISRISHQRLCFRNRRGNSSSGNFETLADGVLKNRQHQQPPPPSAPLLRPRVQTGNKLNDLPLPPRRLAIHSTNLFFYYILTLLSCVFAAGKSVVGCKSVGSRTTSLIPVTQLFGGSHIYKFEARADKFTSSQTIDCSTSPKPNHSRGLPDDATGIVIVEHLHGGHLHAVKQVYGPSRAQ